MQPIWNRAQFKQTGKDTFLSNYWPFVGVCVLLALLSGDLFNLQLQQTSRELVSNSILIYDDPSLGNAVAYGAQLLSPYLAPFVAGSLLLSLLVVFPLQVGASRFFLESRPGYKAPFQRIGHGFVENYGNVFLTGLFKWLFTLLWSLLFLIPGIIRSFGYFAVPYILAENPNLDHSRALQLSLQMTKGYNGKTPWQTATQTALSCLGHSLPCGAAERGWACEAHPLLSGFAGCLCLIRLRNANRDAGEHCRSDGRRRGTAI